MPTIVQSVERAFSILETFDEQNPSRTAAEIAELAGLSRPTTYRLLQTLQQLGYVRNQRGKFEITPTVLRLGAGYLGSESFAGRAQPVLQNLYERVGTRVGLCILDGDEIVPIALAGCPGSPELAAAVQVGYRLPALATTAGRLLLAYVPGSTLPEAAAIRERGYHSGVGSFTNSSATLSVPVIDHHGNARHAVSVAYPANDPSDESRRLVEHHLEAMRQTAHELAALC